MCVLCEFASVCCVSLCVSVCMRVYVCVEEWGGGVG
jgi:hypothetical protein